MFAFTGNIFAMGVTGPVGGFCVEAVEVSGDDFSMTVEQGETTATGEQPLLHAQASGAEAEKLVFYKDLPVPSNMSGVHGARFMFETQTGDVDGGLEVGELSLTFSHMETNFVRLEGAEVYESGGFEEQDRLNREFEDEKLAFEADHAVLDRVRARTHSMSINHISMENPQFFVDLLGEGQAMECYSDPSLGYDEAQADASDQWIQRLQFNRLDHDSGPSASGYVDYSFRGTDVAPGGEYELISTVGMGDEADEDQYTKAWIDWNKDNETSDDEIYDLGFCGTDGCSLANVIEVPEGHDRGQAVLRVAQRAGEPPEDFKSDIGEGEVIDYSIDYGTTKAWRYDTVRGDDSSEHVERVAFAGIDDTSGVSDDEIGYQDRTDEVAHVAHVERHTIQVELAGPEDSTQEAYAWFDWNRNDFLESWERHRVGECTVSDGTCWVETEVEVPTWAAGGPTMLRVVGGVDVPAEPRGDVGAGQAVDYTLNVDRAHADAHDFDFVWSDEPTPYIDEVEINELSDTGIGQSDDDGFTGYEDRSFERTDVHPATNYTMSVTASGSDGTEAYASVFYDWNRNQFLGPDIAQDFTTIDDFDYGDVDRPAQETIDDFQSFTYESYEFDDFDTTTVDYEFGSDISRYQVDVATFNWETEALDRCPDMKDGEDQPQEFLDFFFGDTGTGDDNDNLGIDWGEDLDSEWQPPDECFLRSRADDAEILSLPDTWRNDELQIYPERGDTISFQHYWHREGDTGPESRTFFGVQEGSTDASDLTGYAFRVTAGGGEIALEKWEDGVVVDQSVSSGNDMPAEYFHMMEIDWGVDGEMDTEIQARYIRQDDDADGEVEAEVSLDPEDSIDDAWMDGGIAFRKTIGQASQSHAMFWDRVRVENQGCNMADWRGDLYLRGFTAQNDVTYPGIDTDCALETHGEGTIEYTGANREPTRGNEISFYYMDEGSADQTWFYFGGQDEEFEDSYGVRVDTFFSDEDQLRLERLDGGDGTVLDSWDSAEDEPLNADEWYEFRVQYGHTWNEDRLEVEVYEPGGFFPVATLEADDDTYEEGSIGFGTSLSAGGAYWDGVSSDQDEYRAAVSDFNWAHPDCPDEAVTELDTYFSGDIGASDSLFHEDDGSGVDGTPPEGECFLRSNSGDDISIRSYPDSGANDDLRLYPERGDTIRFQHYVHRYSDNQLYFRWGVQEDTGEYYLLRWDVSDGDEDMGAWWDMYYYDGDEFDALTSTTIPFDYDRRYFHEFEIHWGESSEFDDTITAEFTNSNTGEEFSISADHGTLDDGGIDIRQFDGGNVWWGGSGASMFDRVDLESEGCNLERYTGDTYRWGFWSQDDTTYEGDCAIHAHGDFVEIHSVDGHPGYLYPERGDRVSYRYLDPDDGDSARGQFFFGVQDDDNKYAVEKRLEDPDNPDLELQRVEGGDVEVLASLSDASAFLEQGSWQEIRVDWGGERAGSEITVELPDPEEDGEYVAALEADDFRFSDGGIGFGKDSGADEAYFDYVEIDEAVPLCDEMSDSYSGDIHLFSYHERVDGTCALQSPDDSSGVIYSEEGDGLNAYPERGDNIRFDYWITNRSQESRFHFGMQDTDNHYSLYINSTEGGSHPEDDNGDGDGGYEGFGFDLEVWEGGEAEVLASADLGEETATELLEGLPDDHAGYDVFIQWGGEFEGDSNITAGIYETETQRWLHQIHAEDDTYDDGAVGFENEELPDSYWDSVDAVPEGDAGVEDDGTVEADEGVDVGGDAVARSLSLDPAYLEVTELRAPEWTKEGRDVRVEATVENTGDRPTRQTLRYVVGDDVVDTTEVEVAAGGSQRARFHWDVDVEAGDHRQLVASDDTVAEDTLEVRPVPNPTTIEDFDAPGDSETLVDFNWDYSTCGSPSEYTDRFFGATGDIHIDDGSGTDTTNPSGECFLRGHVDSWEYVYSMPDTPSGQSTALDYYGFRGDTLEFQHYTHRTANSDNPQWRVFFGLQETGSDLTGYAFRIGAGEDTDEIVIEEWDGGTIVDSSSNSDAVVACSTGFGSGRCTDDPIQNWHEYEIEWTDSGWIYGHYTRGDTGDTYTVSHYDTSFDHGGIGFGQQGSGSTYSYAMMQDRLDATDMACRFGRENYQGDTSRFRSQNDVVHTGSCALQSPADLEPEVVSTSGLDDYPERGQMIRYYHYDEGETGYFRFGADGDGNHYGVRVGSEQFNGLALMKDGSFETGESIDVDEDEWYEVVVRWGTPMNPGEITAELYDSDGNFVEEVSMTDTDYDSGGIGFRGESGASVYWDDVRIDDYNVDAEILDFQPDGGDYDAGDVQTADVHVENTGDVENEFFVGYSVENAEIYDGEGEDVVLDPDESDWVTVEWTVTEDAQDDDHGWYDAITAVWDEHPDDGGSQLDTDTEADAFYVNEPAFFDVTITDTNSPVVEGDVLTVDVEIQNTGDNTDTQDIVLEVGGEVRDTESVTVGGGQSENEVLSWNTQEGDAASYTAEAISDDSSDSTSVEVQESAYFQVYDFDAPASSPPGATIEPSATVENTGDETVEQTIEYVFDGDVEDSQPLELEGGESDVVEFTHTLPDETGEYPHHIQSEDDDDGDTIQVEEGPFFEVVEFDAPSEVEMGDTFQVTGTVENVGGEPDTQDVEYVFDGVVESVDADVQLDPGDTHDFDTTHSEDDRGSYEHGLQTDDHEIMEEIDVVDEAEEIGEHAFWDDVVIDNCHLKDRYTGDLDTIYGQGEVFTEGRCGLEAGPEATEDVIAAPGMTGDDSPFPENFERGEVLRYDIQFGFTNDEDVSGEFYFGPNPDRRVGDTMSVEITPTVDGETGELSLNKYECAEVVGTPPSTDVDLELGEWYTVEVVWGVDGEDDTTTIARIYDDAGELVEIEWEPADCFEEGSIGFGKFGGAGDSIYFDNVRIWEAQGQFNLGSCTIDGGSCTITGTIEVPHDAQGGAVLQRTVLRDGGFTAGPYGEIGDGEITDHTVNVNTTLRDQPDG